MLEPFACLSIATAVVQFIDFGTDLLGTAREIYRTNGSSSGINDFEQRVTQFKTLCADLKRANKGHTATAKRDRHRLTEVATQCENLSNDILALLDGLKIQGNPSKRKALEVAVKLRMRSSDLDKYQRKLLERKVDLSTEFMNAIGE